MHAMAFLEHRNNLHSKVSYSSSMLSNYIADAVTWESGLTYQQLRKALIQAQFMLHSGQQLFITAGLLVASTLLLQLYVVLGWYTISSGGTSEHAHKALKPVDPLLLYSKFRHVPQLLSLGRSSRRRQLQTRDLVSLLRIATAIHQKMQ